MIVRRRIHTAGMYTFIVLLVGCSYESGIRLLIVRDREVVEVEPDSKRSLTPPHLPGKIASLAVRSDLTAAVVDANGVATIFSLHDSSPPQELASDALAVAWSNDEQQIAILRSPEGTGWREGVVGIRDRAGDRLLWSEQIAITKPESNIGRRHGEWNFRVSWSADEELIAISTSSADRRSNFPSECIFILSREHKQFYQPGLSDVCFVGARRIVAHRNDERFARMIAYDISFYSDSIALVYVWHQDNAMIAGGNAKTGRIAAWGRPATLVPTYYITAGHLTLYDEKGRTKLRTSLPVEMGLVSLLESTTGRAP